MSTKYIVDDVFLYLEHFCVFHCIGVASSVNAVAVCKALDLQRRERCRKVLQYISDIVHRACSIRCFSSSEVTYLMC